VDDEAPITELAEQLLIELGCDPTVVADPTRAAEIFRADPGRFDLLVTDYTMPGLTGEALIRELRTLRPDLPAILCTGHSHAVDQTRAAALGIYAYCLKPLRIENFARALRLVLQARGGGETIAERREKESLA